MEGWSKHLHFCPCILYLVKRFAFSRDKNGFKKANASFRGVIIVFLYCSYFEIAKSYVIYCGSYYKMLYLFQIMLDVL